MDEEQYHDRVMAVVHKINDVMAGDGDEFGVIVNALITLLALSGKSATLSQAEFCMHVAVQLDTIMSSMAVETHSVQ